MTRPPPAQLRAHELKLVSEDGPPEFGDESRSARLREIFKLRIGLILGRLHDSKSIFEALANKRQTRPWRDL